MAQKKRLLDVWIIDTNTVYRAVPFAVVTDWMQEGRILPADRVRLSGTTAWHQAGKVPAFVPYLPKAEPHRAEDKAEALEPVDMGFHWKNPAESEDEDVDMIPLIDISLVLLIFFMMTATVSSDFFSPIKTPGAKHQLQQIAKDMYWVGVDIKDKDGKTDTGPDGKPVPWYSMGVENKVTVPPTRELPEVLAKLGEELANTGGARVRIRADESLPIETVTKVTLELQGLETKLNQQRPQNRLKLEITGEVSEPKK
jgi:biopolymer transport protein ExbD